jgi:outer membrane translocation and assembly module TamA
LEIKTPIGPLKFTYAVDVEKHTRRAFYITFGTTIP